MVKATSMGFNPNMGIERVIANYDGPGVAVLPSSTHVVPSDAGAGMADLQQRYAPAWDEAMQKFLQPRVYARELLIPGVFSARIRQARNRLDQLAQQKASANLRQAATLLGEDKELRELLDVYRNMLLPG